MIKHGNKPNVLFIDPMATDKGHLICDDLFLTECIMPLAGYFEVATSPASAENIKRNLKVAKREIRSYGYETTFPRLRLVRIVSTLKCSRFSDVIFQSFEEVSTLLFMHLHPHKRVHLIVTNNLKPGRLKRHPILGHFFLREVFHRAASVIVHCQYEADLVKKIFPKINPEKIYIKPFHQMGFSRVRLSLREKSKTILFIGPEQAHKKIKPVVDLIKSDGKCRYNYVLCSMHDNMPPPIRTFLEAQENVRLSYGYETNGDYYRLISEAALIMLTHDKDVEGAFSGVFCDAIASGTPIIARNMAPYNEFFARFGPMGFLVDYDDPQWRKHVLSPDLVDRYQEFQQNMAVCREACSMQAIRETFNKALNRL